jgi:hypothetical protein
MQDSIIFLRKHGKRFDVHFSDPDVGFGLVQAVPEPLEKRLVVAVVDVVLKLFSLTLQLRYLAAKFLLKQIILNS